MDKTAANNLLARIREGDDDALREFYHEYQKKIWTAAFYMTKNVHDAENILSKVIERFWRKDFGYVDNLDGLVYKTTKLTALSYMRDNNKHRYALNHGGDNELEAVAAKDGFEEDVEINEVLDLLEEKDREVVVRHVFFKDSFQEIADDMGITKSAAQRRYRRVQKMLKYLLDTTTEDNNDG